MTGEQGNCFAACIASILEIPLEEAFCAAKVYATGKNWVKCLNDWLAPRGLAYIEVPNPLSWRIPNGYHILGGPSSRGLPHAVVAFAGTMVHDPHPCKDGLSEVTEFGFFVALFAEACA